MNVWLVLYAVVVTVAALVYRSQRNALWSRLQHEAAHVVDKAIEGIAHVLDAAGVKHCERCQSKTFHDFEPMEEKSVLSPFKCSVCGLRNG